MQRLFKNPAIIYTVSRYATYIIQFITSIFIAVKLGPYYLGIWGYVNLIISYISQINFGIASSVNVIVSVNKQNDEYSKKIIANGMTMMLILSAITIFFFLIIHLFGFRIGEKYKFDQFLLPVLFLTIITNFTGYLAIFFRIYGHIISIAIYQSLYPILVIAVIPFFQEENLLWAMIIVNCFSFVISLIYFLLKTPVKLGFQFDFKLISMIQKKGWYLFIYSASFYLILLTTRSFISENYSVKDFGFFTFAFSLANVVLLLLNSISFLIFPKMLNRFSISPIKETQRILESLRVAYISLAHILIHFVIFCFPLFLIFFPKYESTKEVFRLTALAIILYSNSFGYQGYLMAKGKEKTIAFIAFSALILNVILCFVLVYFLQVSFSYVIVATLMTYFIYVLISAKFGRKELHLENGLLETLKDVFPYKMMLPFVISLAITMINAIDWMFSLPLIVFLIFNHRDLLRIKDIIIKMMKNPNFINV